MYVANEAGLIDDEAAYFMRIQGHLPKARKLHLIDLFAGAGGLSLGFTEQFGHSFMPVWANDFNYYAVETYNRNFGKHCVCGDIREILNDSDTKIPKADVVIGGPPCQGFSLLNKKRENDERKQLWRPFLNVVELSQAKIFLMENVPQLLDSSEHHEIIEMATELGFKVASDKLLAADYGVPQKRSRAFILGCNFADPAQFFPPKKTHRGTNNGKYFDLGINNNGYIRQPKPWRTLRDAIGDLPSPVGNEIRKEQPPLDLHFGRRPTPKSIARYMAIPKEGMNRFDLQKNAPELTPICWIKKTSGGTDLFGRLWWDKPAVTIRTEFFKPEKGRYLHPEQHRPITHREAARLQSFPDSFIFHGTKTEIAKQIGNAVPPLMSARLADSVWRLLALGGYIE